MLSRGPRIGAHALMVSLALWLWAGLAWADPYPAPTSTGVNDFAGLIAPAQENALDATLADLRKRTGVEFTVVTLRSRADFDPSASFETFATRLFNGWGIGVATRNDGILLLVLSSDRKVRIELGSGYPQSYDIRARQVMRDVILPEFENGRMANGIVAGTDAIVRQIAEPFAAGHPAPPEPAAKGGPDFVGWLVMTAFVLIAGLMALDRFLGFKLRHLALPFRRCPNCGRRGAVREEKREIGAPDPHLETRLFCGHCDWQQEVWTPRSRPGAGSRSTRRGGGGGFGGGRSSGGGASGGW